jgi:hypothetical protein
MLLLPGVVSILFLALLTPFKVGKTKADALFLFSIEDIYDFIIRNPSSKTVSRCFIFWTT